MVRTHILKEICSIGLLILIWSVEARTDEPCKLQDGRQCQQRCEKNAKNVTYCLCDHGFELEADNITCSAILEIYSITPTFGPETGGTIVTITGKNLLRDPYATVKLGFDIDCGILRLNSTNSTLIIVTPNINKVRAFPHQELPVAVFHQSSGLEAVAPAGFTYRPDPEVRSIRPLSSILSGGIQLTVTGENMMSVARPKLNIYAIATDVHITTFTTICTLSTNTTFFCPSPNLTDIANSRNDLQYFPGLTLDGITKFDYNGVYIPRPDRPVERCYGATTTATYPTTRFPGYPGPCYPGIPGPPGPGGIPGPPGPPTCGFVTPSPPERPGPPPLTATMMPTTTTTLWYPVSCPICANFVVFPNPTVEILQPEELRFRPYSPFNHKFITIKGKDLDRGLSQSDYTVLVGDSLCTDIALSSTHLICTVPTRKPAKSEKSDDILIVVQIGVSASNRFYVGKMIYEENLWHYKPARSGFIAIIVIVPVLVIAIIIAVTICKRSKQKQRKNWFIAAAQKQKEAKPAGMEQHYLHPVKTPSGGMAEDYLHPTNNTGNKNNL